MYIGKIDKIVDKYNNNTYHRTIKWKPGDVKVNTYDGYSVQQSNGNLVMLRWIPVLAIVLSII